MQEKDAIIDNEIDKNMQAWRCSPTAIMFNAIQNANNLSTSIIRKSPEKNDTHSMHTTVP